MKTVLVRLTGVFALCVALGSVGGASAAHQSKTPTWVTTKGKTVNLTIIAGYNNAAGGFSFNGYGQGKLTITIPAGDSVHVTFSNAASLPHSAQIVASKTPPVSAVSDAFAGAHSANPINGVMKGTIQKFSFVASKAGKYLLICAVPGHAPAGMWDNVVVSKGAKAAGISVSK